MAVTDPSGRTLWEARNLEAFVDIFNCRRKRELARICASQTLHGSDLFGLVLSASTHGIPFHYAKHAIEFVPHQLRITQHDRRTMGSAKVGKMTPEVAKAFRKVEQTFAQRRQLVGHMFYTPDLGAWHFFYFDQRDTAPRRNHWKGGAHIHLINHLWPNRTAAGVWREFTLGNPRMKNAEHIRFVWGEDQDVNGKP